MAPDLRGRSLLQEADLTREEFCSLLDLASTLRTQRRAGTSAPVLAGTHVALLFEKPSTRTRSAFEVAAHDLGAHVTYLGPDETQLGNKESMKDTARVLGRMFDAIAYRGSAQSRVEALARHSGVPVWNGLTDEWHPTQSLADLRTMLDHSDRQLGEITYCYVGDARNNTANSLLATGALLGCDVRIAAPASLLPDESVRALARTLAAASGARITLTEDPAAAVAGCDFVLTDVWVSMGEPTERWAERIELLGSYRVDSALMAATGTRATKFMHCLPAMHTADAEIGEWVKDEFGLDALEVTDEVFESDASIVFDQAENRLHTIRALLAATLAR